MENKVTAFLFVPDPAASQTKIYGLTLLERSLHALERGGVGRVFLPKAVQNFLGETTDWKIEIQFSDDFKKKLEGLQDTGVLVLTEPLVIDPKFVQQLLEKSSQSDSILIGKSGEIVWYPTKAMKAVVKERWPNFDQMTALTHQHVLATEKVDFQGLVCSTVRSAIEKNAVEKELIRSLTKPTDGWVSRNLNRPISTLFSRVLAHTSITPNQFTIVTGLIGLSTAWFLAKGAEGGTSGYWNYLIGGALFHFTSVLDGVDGELARLKFKSSPFGQWLDTVVDNTSYLAALGGIITGLYLHGAPQYVIYAGILSVVFAVSALGSLYFYLLRFKSGGTLLNVKYGFQDGNSTFDKIFQVAAAFGKRDLFALIFFILGIFGKMQWALVYIAIMAFMVFVFSVQAHFSASKAKGNSV
ncbi:MAG: CDP-alcohol phosphatidyltransferase family protein [Saprospiraceae bacterium]|nr:CDP-alcohol phosphatidyltransferase family protein [Saprospiraceae bacterium]MCF8251722.1 CDP-alcohol phosphatidyltransferase family protein [Saprospiraceae bacterium]MCF8281104.1 CDP-alcohol phosphatidyltransferase family protein [Bacteroidales bacterium]MCF8311776.1 CDP-alcohol phosphatidyltransferase family protein [Saprospiraceae bacterium]MCF8441774.1 CDP-alcohol phosphatidyltransferase family protein [Saprospiraceae bacterium]